MKYILLDTNIVIDMVIDRRHQVTDALLSSFIRLLDYNEIKLIVPEIVKVETQRHLEAELVLVGKQINNVMKNIDDLYGVATYTIAGLDIQQYKKQSKRELAKAYEMYQKNEGKYRSDLEKTIDMVFDHRNSLIIPCDDFLCNAVTKRRIFKRAPFHIEQKESFGDGLIVETLINIQRYISLDIGDEVLFVTGNYIDFCIGKNAKTTLLPDIVNDIKASGVPCPVICINTFGQLIGKELRDNVENANLSEEFEKELQRQYDEDVEQLVMEARDMERESVDLTPMHSYSSKLEEDLIDSDFVTDIVKIFDELNTMYSSLVDEGCDVLYEELSDKLKYISVTELVDILTKFKKIFDKTFGLPCISGDDEGDFTTDDLLIVFEWLEGQHEFIKRISNIDYLPDNISYGDTITITNSKLDKLEFSLDKLYLSPEEGSSEDIDMRIYGNGNKIVASGNVSVTYGFIEFDDDGGIGDGISDDISYEYRDITATLKDIVDEWKELVSEQIEIAEQFREEFELD